MTSRVLSVFPGQYADSVKQANDDTPNDAPIQLTIPAGVVNRVHVLMAIDALRANIEAGPWPLA
jgi:hypothetical protein